MRIIFLDVDGVLNSESTPNPRKLPYIVEQSLLELLKRLLTLTDANTFAVTARSLAQGTNVTR